MYYLLDAWLLALSGCEKVFAILKDMKQLWGLLRIMLGWIFLWPFLDKLFGWGFATEAGQGWLQGGSPTAGFLQFGTKGPLAEYFQSLAGQAWVDWLFMAGLLPSWWGVIARHLDATGSVGRRSNAGVDVSGRFFATGAQSAD